MYFNSNHAHDQVMRISVSGIMCFVGSTPIGWSSKRQGAIDTPRYYSEFCAGWVETEELVVMRYMLMSLSVPVKVPSKLCGDNLGTIISCTNSDSELKHNNVAIFVSQVAGECSGQYFQPY